jgi:hypothetical protein
MNITILSVQTTTETAKSGKPYQQLQVAFKNNTFGKVESKKIMPFGAQKAAFDALANAPTGAVFEVTVVKNDAGYNDWTAVTATPPGSIVPVPPGSINKPTMGQTTQVKSTYETPAERAQKQIYIVKQSSIGSAIELLSVGAKSPPTVDAVLDTAQKLYGWVMSSPDQEVKQDVFDVPNDVDVD